MSRILSSQVESILRQLLWERPVLVGTVIVVSDDLVRIHLGKSEDDRSFHKNLRALRKDLVSCLGRWGWVERETQDGWIDLVPVTAFLQ